MKDKFDTRTLDLFGPGVLPLAKTPGSLPPGPQTAHPQRNRKVKEMPPTHGTHGNVTKRIKR